ncbi:MAG TPA: DUF488 domain-containing protein [Mycobacteriales bacterium]|nr:DUF488 domain-containing protein [Mycobacteriales bacterium]
MTGALVTLGYEQRTLTELADALVDAGVEMVVDVRLTPMSRKPGMSKKRISEAVEAVGIEYVHAKALGNPKDNRDGFHRGEPAALARYRTVLDSVEASTALDDIADALKTKTVALLCLEADPQICHRTLVAEAVRKKRRVRLLEL